MATATLQFAVKAALLSLWTTALTSEDIQVVAGMDVAEDSLNVLRVGNDNPMVEAAGTSSDSQTTIDNYGAMANSLARREEGNVPCWLWVSNGDVDSAGADANTARFLDICQQAIQDTNWTLGIGGAAGLTRAWMSQFQVYADEGLSLVVFNVSFVGHIPT